MPHEKTRVSGMNNSGALTLDRRRALTISPVEKFDSCRSGNPLKIHKRNILSEDKCADLEATTSTPKCTKIHWRQLASNGSSSQPVHRRNGRQAGDHDLNNAAMLDINRRQVKIILTDVLQTEDGQRYLESTCGNDLKTKRQSEIKRGTRERRSDGQFSSVPLLRERRRSSPAITTKQMNSSDLKPANSPFSKHTGSAYAEDSDVCLTRETRSPLSKRIKRNNSSVKQTETSISVETESFESSSNDPLQTDGVHNASPRNPDSPGAEENESYPVEVSESSPPHFEGTDSIDYEVVDSEHVSEVTDNAAWKHPPSRLSFSQRRQHRTEHSGNKDPTQHNSCEEEETTGDVGMQEEENKQDREEEVEVEPLHQNGEVMEDRGGARRSVLRLSAVAYGGQVEIGLTDGEEPHDHSHQYTTTDEHVPKKASKPQPIEPIVLSSEEEEEDKEDIGTSHSQTLEGAKDPHTAHRPTPAVERKKAPDPHSHTEMHTQASSFVRPALSCPTVMELQFSALYMAGLSAFARGFVKIALDKTTILLKDPSGSEVKASLPTSQVRKYSVLDSSMLQDCGLLKELETLPPSLLLLWLSDHHARRLSSELSVIQPGTRPAEGGVCVLLCLCDPLNGVQGALLASIMDIVGLTQGSAELLSPRTHTESLKLLQSSRDTHLLQLLGTKADAHTILKSASSPVSASTLTTVVKDSDAQSGSVYTVCHRRAQGSYRVSMVPRPGDEWTPYRHQGPSRRLIQFPAPPSKGAITVSTEDLECLDSGEFLNDVIIDFYLKYLLVQKAPRSSVERVHIFSSFFYKQLTRRDNANEDSTSTPSLRRHQRVRTWTRHVDIFEKDFLFVPVNQEAHWYLVVVCFPGLEEPQYVDRVCQSSAQDGSENSMDSLAGNECQEGQRSDDMDRGSDESSLRTDSVPGPPDCTEKTCRRKTVCKRPCILIMDSLKLSVHERIFKLLREYLQVEWEVKRGGQRDFSAERMVGSHCRVPLQDNSSDCGLYLLQYAESFLQDPVVHFDLPLRLEHWFLRQRVREKRQEIRNLVLHLYRFQQGSLGNEASEDSTETVA